MEVRKPLSVAREEFLHDLVNLINSHESDLPACVTESVLKDIMAEVHSAVQRQYEADRRAYEEALDSQESPEES